MKINELSKMTGVKAETIRMYRQQGFLKPMQDDNGYYNYTYGDYVSLIYIRKLRDFTFPMDEIQTFFSSSSSGPLLDLIDQRIDSLRDQIQKLNEKIAFLQMERRHIVESSDAWAAKDRVALFQSLDEKVDFYNITPFLHEKLNQSIADFYLNSTPCLFIPKEVLNGPVENREIPLKAGVGTYRHYFTRPLSVPDQAVIIPNGISIGEFISLDQLDTINILQLAPMMNYAKELGKPFISDTTGYLADMTTVDGKRVFNFRIRACIEANDIVDPQTASYRKTHHLK